MTNTATQTQEHSGDAAAFLGALFANVQRGWSNLLCINGARRKETRARWVDLSAPDAFQAVQQAVERANADGWEVYISTCPAAQKGANGTRISRGDVACIPAYFLDLDTGKASCPSSIEAAQKALEALPYPPGMTVCSGRGLHAYWLLKEPVQLTEETRDTAGAALRRFADAIAAQMGFPGLDTFASEPARVLRVPGTCNHKTPAAPLPVFLLASTGERYDAATLDQWADSMLPQDAEENGAAQKKKPVVNGAKLSDERVFDLAKRGKNGALFTRLWNGDSSDFGGDQSRADMELCGLLAFYTGRNAVQMDNLFRSSLLYREKWDEKRGALTYGEKTIEEAIKNCSVCYSPRNAEYDPERHADGDPLAEFAQAYKNVPPYSVNEHGELCYTKKERDEEITVKLASFVCLIAEERKLDNGQDEPTLQFHIKGRAAWSALPSFDIGAREFQAMNWPLEKWGTRANIVPGQAVKDKLRYAISAASDARIRRVSVFTHTGFRKINGTWAYLYHGGAIGADSVQVDLSGDGLESFVLEEAPGISPVDALRGSLSLRSCMSDRVALPLLAYAYLAPLCSFLMDAACPPAFTVFLKGRTQTRKTTAAVLCQQHFGATFSSRRLPASFEDTANSIRAKAFALKDAVLLVDDAHPAASPKERDKLADTVNALASAWGERKGRGRCGADGRNTATRPPRGLGLLTGEDLPGTNESALSRFFIVEVGAGDVPAGDKLTAVQRLGETGVFCQAMRGYVEWLAGQGDALPDTLRAMFTEYRVEAMKRGGLRDRLYETVAHLRIGIEMLARYAVTISALTTEDAEKLRAASLACFYSLATAQTADIAEEAPSTMFIEALRDLLSNNTCSLHAIGAAPGAFIAYESDIGFRDTTTAYVNPGQSYAAVQDYFKRQGRTFPISKGTLFKRMADEGVCQSFPGKSGADFYAWPKAIGGHTYRLVRLDLKTLIPTDEGAGTPVDAETHMEVSNLFSNGWTSIESLC